ncbi:MAG: hypothetical protein F7O42_05330 [Opitutae bacterium]|nr:hypothetical protein [Opitutae bacterium]
MVDILFKFGQFRFGQEQGTRGQTDLLAGGARGNVGQNKEKSVYGNRHGQS